MSKGKISFGDFAKKLQSQKQAAATPKVEEPAKPMEFKVDPKVTPEPQVDPLPEPNGSSEMETVESDGPSTALEVITEPALPAVEVEGPAQFKMELDRLDSLMYKDIGDQINTFNMDAVRETVMRIMVDLKSNPAYDGLIIDRDVHNIFKFIRFTGQRAELNNVATKVNKQAKAAKTKKMTFVDSGFEDFLPNALSDMAKMEF